MSNANSAPRHGSAWTVVGVLVILGAVALYFVPGGSNNAGDSSPQSSTKPSATTSPATHPTTTSAADGFARVRAAIDAGDYEAADKASAEAYQQARSTAGFEPTAEFATLVYQRALALRKLGRPAEAQELADEAVRLREKLGGDALGRELADAVHLRGRLMLDDGDPTNAEADLARAVEIARAAALPITDVVLYAYHLGDCQFRLQKYEDAESNLVDGMRFLAARGKNHTDPTPFEACRRVVELYETLERNDEANMYRQRCPDKPD